jgi:hypothetical protein
MDENLVNTIERLKRMVSVLKTVNPRCFVHDRWANEDGSVCDATGWCAQSPWFNKQGLELQQRDGYRILSYGGFYGRPVVRHFFNPNCYCCVIKRTTGEYETEGGLEDILFDGDYFPEREEEEIIQLIIERSKAIISKLESGAITPETSIEIYTE